MMPKMYIKRSLMRKKVFLKTMRNCIIEYYLLRVGNYILTCTLKSQILKRYLALHCYHYHYVLQKTPVRVGKFMGTLFVNYI